MTALEQAGLDDLVRELTAELRGTVTPPGNPKYDSARLVWNAMFDARRPAAVVRCEDEDDVATAVRLLRDADVPVAVRGGGHHIAGFGTCEGGFVIDLGATAYCESRRRGTDARSGRSNAPQAIPPEKA